MHNNTFDSLFGTYMRFTRNIMRMYNAKPEDVYVKNEADDFVGEEEKNKSGNCASEKSDIGWDKIEVRRFVTCKEDITLPFKLFDQNRDIDQVIDDINIMRRYMFEITKTELSSYRAKNSEHIKFLLMSNFDKIKVFDPIIFDENPTNAPYSSAYITAFMNFAFEYFIEYDIKESQFKFCSNTFKEWEELKNLISKSKFIPLCIH